MNFRILAILVLAVLLVLYLYLPPRRSGRRRVAPIAEDGPVYFHQAPKPEWVRLKIISFKAMMPGMGCRKLAETFNRSCGHLGITVGKTYVSNVIRKHQWEIKAQRRQVRNRKHRPTSPNRVWGLDLTFVSDEQGTQYPVLGIVDHGTRLCLAMLPLRDKSATSLVRAVHGAVRQYGVPKIIRTDNEGTFKSWLFRFGLRMFGIRHQLTDPHCPWQNGRIERFFGTFKQHWADWSVNGRWELKVALHQFRTWYNQVRPHQHLQGMTPAEAWAGIDIRRQPMKDAIWFDAWDGLLTGYYIRR